MLFTTTALSVIITMLILASILFESLRFFDVVNPMTFFFGTTWNPQAPIYEGQTVSQSSFGIIPVLLGTFLVTSIAVLIAIPLGIMAAIHLSFYSAPKARNILKPVLEILAGIPTVIYGYFAATSVAPFLKNAFGVFGINLNAESALVAGVVIGMMIIPFVASLADDALLAVPTSLKDGAFAIGSTRSEMITKVAIPFAMPNLLSAMILAASRAIGETMIVVMAAGLVANLTLNPLSSTTTVTVQIVTLLTGDQEFDSPKTLASFALAMVLFILTLSLNFIAILGVRKTSKRNW